MNSVQPTNAPCLHTDGWSEVLSRMSGTDSRFAALSGSSLHEALGKLVTKRFESTDVMSKVSIIPDSVECHTLSPDGTLLAVFFRSYPMMRVYELKTKRQLLVLRMGMMPGVLDMAFSSDSSIFAIYGDRAYLIHRFTKVGGEDGVWHVERIRSIERRYSVNVGIMGKEVGISFSEDMNHVVFQEVSVDLRRGKGLGIKVKYEDVDISHPRDVYDQEQGVTTTIIRWKENNSDRNVTYEARRFRLVDFTFTAHPNRTYIPPGCVSKMFGVVISVEKSLNRLIFARCETAGKLIEARPSPCGNYLFELRKQWGEGHVVRKISMNDLKDVDISALPILRSGRPMKVADFLINGNIAVVIFAETINCRSSAFADSFNDSFSTFTPHGWAVYDTRHSGSFYTVLKQNRNTEYQADKGSITLSSDGQLIGFIPVRQEKHSDCELHIFDVSSGRLAQVRKIRTACSSPDNVHITIAPERCVCRHVIGAGLEALVSTSTGTPGAMSFAWSSRRMTKESS